MHEILPAMRKLWLASLLCVACSRAAPATPIVSSVEFSGVESVDERVLRDGIATAESPKFLGIWDGVAFEYELYDEELLRKDLERIERAYRAAGYYEAKVSAARIVRTGHRVRVEIDVQEGAPVKLRSLNFQGLDRVPLEVSADILRQAELRVGRVLSEKDYDQTKGTILTVLGDHGYAFAQVRGTAEVDIARHSAAVKFEVVPGKVARFGKVRIVGLSQIPADPVLDTLAIREVETYSQSDLEDARTALVNLGVFRSVELQQDTSGPASRAVPITVRVEESALRTLRLGGGARLDVLELSGGLKTGWEHRNLFGGLRYFTAEMSPRAVLYPTRIADEFNSPSRILLQNKIRAELHQPSFLEGRTTGNISGTVNVFPLLYPNSTADDPVVGFVEVAGSAGLVRPFYHHHIQLGASYHQSTNYPFDYAALTLGDSPDSQSEELNPLRISYPRVNASLDFRDDALDPKSGVLARASVERATHLLGDLRDWRIQPEIRTYVKISKTVTFATRTTLGLLFPSDYGHTLVNSGTLSDGAIAQDQQKLVFRAFYSGGPNSNRGYPFRSVGPHGVLTFLSPSSGSCQRAECLQPLGGLTLWEASLEVRHPVYGQIRGVTFLDASDVTRSEFHFRDNALHLSFGGGLRYPTPVGPLRLDVGYRLPWLNELQATDPREGDPGDIFGLPVALHFGLGQAF